MNLVNPHPQGCFWYDMAQKYGAPDIKYCEQTICSFISEPANTWSNLAFIFVGIFIAFYFKQRVKDMSPALKAYGWNTVAVGVSSFVYHLSNNFVTQYFDFLGMYAFAGLLMFYHLEQLKLLSGETLLRNDLLSFIPFSLLFFVFRVNGIPVQLSVLSIALVVLVTKIILVRKYHPRFRLFFYALFSFITAGTFQILDIKRVGCNPQNHILQFHALWHVFNALGMGLLFLYYLNFHKTVMDYNERAQ